MPTTNCPTSRRPEFCLWAALMIGWSLSGFAATATAVTLTTNSGVTEIQSALDALPPGGEVYLAAGVYEITRPLLMQHDHTTLRGSGRSTVLRLADNADCPVIILGPSLREPERTATHLQLSSLVIEGNRANQSVEYWRSASDGSVFNNNGIEAWHVADTVIEHVVCRSCRSGGIVLVQARRLHLNDFASYNNQFDGLACYQTEDCRFNNLDLHDNLAAGISLDLEFAHNSISNALLSGNDLGIFMRASSENSFRDVTVRSSRHHGVFMAQTAVETAAGWRSTPGTECIGNDFQDLAISDSGGQAFRVNDATCIDNVISGGRFERNALGGLSEPLAALVSTRALVER